MHKVIRRKLSHRELIAMLLAMLALCFALLSPSVAAITVGGPSDCDNNAIIRCGAHTTSELIQAYNASSYVQANYAYFGISHADISSLASTNVPGRVTRGGNVLVDGQSYPVANAAVTSGRQDISGSTTVTYRGATFYKRTPSVSFQQSSLPAFISMKNGVFQFAVLASCGNPVKATPVMPKPTPTPAPQKPTPTPVPTPPAPAQTQSQTQSQSQSVTVNNTNINNNQKEETPPVATTVPSPTPTPVPVVEEAVAATPTKAASLPNTGPGAVVVLFSIAAMAGAYGFRRHVLKRMI